MPIIYHDTVEECYRELILRLIEDKNIVGNTKEIQNAMIVVNYPTLKKFRFPYRKISEKYAEAELKWYWSGDNSCHTIGQHAKMWLSLTDDGMTNNSAYGYILEKKYGFDQIQQIIKLLKKDPNSRRAVLNISDPSINRIKTKDMQCTIALQFLIRDEKLQTTVYMRSNDVYFGFPYDYIYFVSIASYIADKLGIKLGQYIHNATSIHMYLKDEEKFNPHDQTLSIDYKSIIKENYHV